MTTPEEGPLWTVHIPGGGIKKVHLPPLPDKISWVMNFKDGSAKRFSYQTIEKEKEGEYGGDK